jgi:hypothetical protein
MVRFDPRRRYPYFDVVAGLAWSEDPESYAGGSTATDRDSHVGQVKGDGRTGWRLGVGLTTPPCKTCICLKTSTEASESGGRRLGRPWPENRPKRHRIRRRIFGLIRFHDIIQQTILIFCQKYLNVRE